MVVLETVLVSKDAKKMISDGLRAVSVGVARLVERYDKRKNELLSGDEKRLLDVIYAEISNVVSVFESLGVKVSSPEGQKSLKTALECAVRASEVWGEVKNDSNIERYQLERIAMELKTVKVTLGFSIFGGLWK